MKPTGRRAWRQAGHRLRRKERRDGYDMSNDYGVFARRHEKNEFFTLTEVPSRPFTSRSLIGMTMGARKRAAWYEALRSGYDGRISNRKLRLCLRSVLTADVLAVTVPIEWRLEVRAKYRIGERLRPCPGCEECRGYDDGIGVVHCDGSGVMPARKQR